MKFSSQLVKKAHQLTKVNPMNLRGLPKDKVVRYVNRLITSSYAFFGYIEFANYISRKSYVEDPTDLNQQQMMQARMTKSFSGRLLIIDEIHNELEGKAVIGKVNIDENSDVPVTYGVRNIPTLLVFKNGEVVDKVVGNQPKSKLIELLNNHM